MERAFFAAIVAALSAACSFEHRSNVLVPTDLGSQTSRSYVGTWTSQSTATTVGANVCGNFMWQVTSQTLTMVTGTFSADCGGGLRATGTASGQIGGNTLPLTATGSATGAGITTPCTFSISGAAQEVDTNTLRIPYSGTTCVGPITGIEVLRRR